MIYKTTSSKAIIARVYNDFKPSGSSWVSGAVDWMGDAMGLIGYHGGLETKTTCVKIKDFRGCFPDDFESLIGVIYKGRRLPISMSKAKFPIHLNKNFTPLMLSNDDLIRLETLTKQIEQLDAFLLDEPDNTDFIDAKAKATAELNGLTESKYIKNTSTYGVDYYSINPDYIITSFEDGEITIIYQAFMVDEEGFPKIPDTPKYKDAVLWYIIRTMILSGYKHPFISFGDADQMWEVKRKKAANDIKISTLDEKQRALNLTTRVRFSRELGDNFFIGGEGQFNEI